MMKSRRPETEPPIEPAEDNKPRPPVVVWYYEGGSRFIHTMQGGRSDREAPPLYHAAGTMCYLTRIATQQAIELAGDVARLPLVPHHGLASLHFPKDGLAGIDPARWVAYTCAPEDAQRRDELRWVVHNLWKRLETPSGVRANFENNGSHMIAKTFDGDNSDLATLSNREIVGGTVFPNAMRDQHPGTFWLPDPGLLHFDGLSREEVVRVFAMDSKVVPGV